MQDWQKRVIEERVELGAKIINLIAFINSDKFNAIDDENQKLLRDQRDVMVKYLAILDKRIIKF
ncbi:MAG: crAss001_48 related protein [Vibrio sp.]